MGGWQQPDARRLSKAELLAGTGIKPRQLIHLRRLGIIEPVEPRHGLGDGGGRGTTPIEYPSPAIATI
jgi:hypothetical protein